MNPIRNKLEKMFNRKKKRQITIQSTINQSHHFSQISLSQVKQIEDKQCLSHYSISHFKQEDKQNIQSTQQYSMALDQMVKMKQQLQNYKKMTRKLEQKLHDHERLEQFYLQQLQERAETEKQLKWRLQLINEQIKSNRLSTMSFRDWPESVTQSYSERALSTDY